MVALSNEEDHMINTSIRSITPDTLHVGDFVSVRDIGAYPHPHAVNGRIAYQVEAVNQDSFAAGWTAFSYDDDIRLATVDEIQALQHDHAKWNRLTEQSQRKASALMASLAKGEHEADQDM